MFCNAVRAFIIAAAVASAAVTNGPPKQMLHCSSDELRCGDGRCVGLASICDGVRDCSDGLDEGVCEPGFDPSLVYGNKVRRSKRDSGSQQEEHGCILPEYPKNGRYDKFVTQKTVMLKFTCNPGFHLIGKDEQYCYNGTGFDEVPLCVQCGTITPSGKQYVLNGVRAIPGEVPWHAGIYRKTTSPYRQICGGTLVTATAVISAAYCFWDDVLRKLPAKNYAVAVGKVYRPFNNKFDNYSQSSDVNEIHIPEEFRGASTRFQTDIAVLILETAIKSETYIRPICVSFSPSLDERQLSIGQVGKMAAWELTNSGNASNVLRVKELPYVDFDRCYNESPEGFRDFLHADKFCAGYTNGTALCVGDGGGGLAFYDQGEGRYYLRGILSTTPYSNQQCDPFARATFTRIIRYERFLKDYINDWE